ncbi:MAG: TolC family protein [Nitrospirota bacterium]
MIFLIVLSVSSVYSMTVDEAVTYALKNNPELQSLGLEEEVAKGQLEKAKLPLIANPTLEGSVSKKDKTQEEGSGAFTNYGVKLSQEFEIAGQRKLRVNAAEKSLSKTGFEIKDRERELTYAIKDAFAKALTAKRRVELVKEVVKLQEELLGFTIIKYQAGDVSGLEVNLAEVELSKAKRDLLSAEKESKEALLALQGLMGARPDTALNLEGELAPDTLSLPARERLQMLAASQRPDIKAAYTEEERSKTAIALAKREAVPNVTLSGFYDKDERKDIVGVAVSIPLPLFDRKQAEKKEAKARAEQAKLRLAGLEKTIEREIEEAYSTLTASLNELALFKKEIESKTLENLNLLNLAFKEGKISFFDVRLAQRETIEIQFSHLDSMLRARQALNAMEKAIGGAL